MIIMIVTRDPQQLMLSLVSAVIIALVGVFIGSVSLPEHDEDSTRTQIVWSLLIFVFAAIVFAVGTPVILGLPMVFWLARKILNRT